MNLLTYSVKFVQPSIEFVSNNQGYKQKKKINKLAPEQAKNRQHVSYSTGYGSRRGRVTQLIFLCLVINR